MKPIYLLITFLFLTLSYSLAQQGNNLNLKVPTKYEDILKADIQSHNSKIVNDSERLIVKTTILENGYILESKMGQFWDGNDWVNSSLDLYTYTTEGLKTEEVNQLWNNGGWENYRRFLTTYYLNELVALNEEQTWNGTDWENSYQYEYVYNVNSQLTEYNVYQWNGSVWDNMYKTIYAYYTSGNLETITDQQWDGTSWLNSYKYSFQYNTNDDVSERLTEEWIEGNWKETLLDEYTYNPQNQLALIASFWWSETFWKESVEIHYAYDGMGNVIDRLTKFWESEILGLQNKYHTTYEFLPTTSLETLVENQEWNLQLAQWMYTSKETKTYNEKNDILNYLSEGWDGSSWIPGFQENYTYDENGNLDILLSQYWSGTEWTNSFKAFYTWSPVTSIETENGSVLPFEFSLEQNYPNPFNPNTVIEFSLPEDVSNVKLSIYNALGEKVAELVNTSLTSGKYSHQWNAQNVATGMYIYELRTDNFVSKKKMILLK